MNIHKRLNKLRLEKRVSLQDVGAAISVSWQTVQQWENGGTAPKRTRLDDVAAYYNVTVNYLLNGDNLDEETYAYIDSIDLKLSAGTGNIVTTHDIDKQLAFRAEFLKGLGVKPENAKGFPVDGDSMVDANIPDGSIVVINAAKKEPANKKYFAIWIEDKYFIKQLIKSKDQWIARSHNKEKANKYPDKVIDTENSGIIGQAIWCAFRL